MSVATDLPALTPDETAHSDRVRERICADIASAGGWIGFGRYMQLALYEPGLGYYSAGARKFGAAGDFITAPEVAPVFSRCLAVQCEEILRATGGDILELGAGSGAMAAQMLAELERRDALPDRYRILDLSAGLRDRQHETIEASVPHLRERVEWLDRLPESHAGVIVANEVLDAMPVERFVIRGGEVLAQGVSCLGGRPHRAESTASGMLEAAVRRIERDIDSALPEAYASEVNLALGDWLAALAAILSQGAMLFVDYGLPRREYYLSERQDGTLLCHFRHRFHVDPFTRPGLQDITAWVDFTAVAEAAQAAGLSVAGYTTQAQFLIGNGLPGFVANVADLDIASRVAVSRQAMLLTLPDEMGERFKVIALAKNCDAPLAGFAVRDLRHTL
jgi:SAM-dependent MidA family methyltransferase